MSDESKKLCNYIMDLVSTLLPGKIFFHHSNDLEKIIEHILGRATNEPKTGRQYAKLCYDIVCKLPGEKSKAKFKTTLVSMIQSRFTAALEKKNQPLNVRNGTVRFVGELYNFNFVTEKIVRAIMGKILHDKSPLQLYHFQFLTELIKVAGWKLNEEAPQILKTFKEEVTQVSTDQTEWLCAETRKLVIVLLKMMCEKDFIDPNNLPIICDTEQPAIDISKLTLKPKKNSCSGPDIVLEIEEFLSDPSLAGLEKLLQDVKLIERELSYFFFMQSSSLAHSTIYNISVDNLVNILHLMGSQKGAKLANAIAVICKWIDTRKAVPHFKEALLKIIIDNLIKFNKYASIFFDADCDFNAYKINSNSLLKIQKDTMPLVVNAEKDIINSFKFFCSLYNQDFTSSCNVLSVLDNLSTSKVVSNLTLECFETIFTLTQAKLLDKEIIPIVLGYFDDMLKASKFCPKTPKTNNLINGLVSDAQIYLNHSFIEMLVFDSDEIDFPTFESEFQLQKVDEPLWWATRSYL